MTGKEIREMVFSNGFKLWQVADVFGKTANWLSIRLRKPFNEKEVAEIKAAIETLKARREAEKK